MSNWRNFGDVSTKLAGYEIVTIEDPTVAIGTQDDLLMELSRAASDGFAKEKDMTAIKEHVLIDQTRAFVATKNGVAVAFLAVESLKNLYRGVFLTGLVMYPEYQNSGVGSFLTKMALESEGYEFFAGTTQSPIVYGMLKKLSSNLYPDVQNERIPVNLQDLGQTIMKGRGGRFDKTTFICYDYYDTFLYKTYPWSKNKLVNGYFMEKLKVVNGETRNGFLLIGFTK